MSTILIVEHIPTYLESTSQILRKEGFKVLGCSTGEEALALLALHQVDLLLLDVMTPGLDGLTILGTLRKSQRWGSLPVVLLAETANEAHVRSAATAGVQGFLLRSSLSPTELLPRICKLLPSPRISASPDEQKSDAQPSRCKNTVFQTGQQPGSTGTVPSHDAGTFIRPNDMGTSKNDPNEVLARVRSHLELRSVPPVLEYVIALTGGNRTSLDEVVAAVRQDQALALKVMKVANSSFYTTGKRAQSLAEATQRIGLSGIRNTAAAILAIDHFGDISAGGLIPQRFWEHSVATALLTQLFGEAAKLDDPDALFLAGLLHDVGRLVLSSVLSEDYQRVLASAGQPGFDLVSAEEEAFGLNHADITKEVLMRLKLPEMLVTAASLHTRPIDRLKRLGHDARQALIVSLANRAAHALALGDSGDSQLYPLHEAADALGLSAKTVGTTAREAIRRAGDLELLYASHTDVTFRKPFAKELARRADVAVKAIVLAAEAPNDPFSLLAGRLAWLDPQEPQIAVLYVRSKEELPERFDALSTQEASLGTKLGIVLASSDRSWAPAMQFRGRPCRFLQVPCSYAALIEAMREVQAASHIPLSDAALLAS